MKPRPVEVTVTSVRGVSRSPRRERFIVDPKGLKGFLRDHSRQGEEIRIKYPNGQMIELVPVNGVLRTSAINRAVRMLP